MQDVVIKTSQGYEISYGGGRLANVILEGHAVETVQVRDYDFETGTFGAEPTDADIRETVARFIQEAGGIEVYRENML